MYFPMISAQLLTPLMICYVFCLLITVFFHCTSLIFLSFFFITADLIFTTQEKFRKM